MNQNTDYSVQVTFPISFSSISYNAVSGFLTDAGNTFYLRQHAIDTYTFSSVCFHFWATNHNLKTTGIFSYHIIGY